MDNTYEDNLKNIKKLSRYWAWQSKHDRKASRVIDLEQRKDRKYLVVASNTSAREGHTGISLNTYSGCTLITYNEMWEHDGKWVPVREEDFKAGQYQYRVVDNVKVKLNDDYDAIVSKDTIEVGCQTFPISILDELVEARKQIVG